MNAAWCSLKYLNKLQYYSSQILFMKKITGLSAIATVLLVFVFSCKPEAAKKEVIVVPAASPVIIVKDPVVKPTTITLDKNGVKVEAKKIDVVIKPATKN